MKSLYVLPLFILALACSKDVGRKGLKFHTLTQATGVQNKKEAAPSEGAATNSDHDFIEHMQSELGDVKDINERASRISAELIGRDSGWQQVTNPSEEKVEKLSVNFSFLDCVRYVEQVIALARSSSESSFEEELKSVRYKGGIVSFAHRLHFPESDWIPENIRNHTLVNSTKAMSRFNRASYKLASTTIDKENWFKTLYPGNLEELRSDFPHDLQIPATLDYVDFDSMWTNPIESRPDSETKDFLTQESAAFKAMSAEQDLAAKKTLQLKLDGLRKTFRLKGASLDPNFVKTMRNFSVVAVVRPTHNVTINGKLVTNMLVTHMGFVVKRDGKLFFRHAPSKAGSKVIELPFEEYFAGFLTSGGNLDSATNRRSTWRGLNILSLRQYNN